MNNTFFDGHDEQSLGKIVQRAPAVGGKMWCLSLFSFSVCHAPRPLEPKYLGGLANIWGPVPPGPNVEPPLVRRAELEHVGRAELEPGLLVNWSMLFAGFGSLVDLSIPRCYYFWLLFDQPVLLEITPGKARSPIGLSKSEESVRIAGARLFYRPDSLSVPPYQECHYIVTKIAFQCFDMVGRQERHLACKKLGVGLLMWRFDWIFARLVAPAVTTTFVILSSYKIQSGDSMVPANPGKWPLKWKDIVTTKYSSYQIVQRLIWICLSYWVTETPMLDRIGVKTWPGSSSCAGWVDCCKSSDLVTDMLHLQDSVAYTVSCTVIVVDESHNCFLIAVLHVTEILISAVYKMIQSMGSKKSSGATTQPCRTPEEVSNHGDSSPPTLIQLKKCCCIGPLEAGVSSLEFRWIKVATRAVSRVESWSKIDVHHPRWFSIFMSCL